ncbi:hypothetical protein [Bacillus sp. Marseille-Q3570]|uniref:hypothetical protein n=1 Tax=Bacillus sp. Marseille-Q3570 TaxID=2963522 RepID=UPI0021B82953|nr:hypothetical protein [Bacillus sp. Marseille-Q3570]
MKKFENNFVVGLFIGVSPEEIQFKRNVKNLRKEKWFSDLYGNAYIYEQITQNGEARKYLSQKNIVNKLRSDKNEKDLFLKMVK